MTLAIVLLALAQSPLPALQLWITQRITDSLVAITSGGEGGAWIFSEVLGRFWPFILGGLLLALLGQGLTQLQGMGLGLLGQRLTHRLNQHILLTAATVDYAQFDHPAFYDKLQRAQQDASSRSPQLLSLLLNLLQQGLITITLIGTIFRLEPRVAGLLAVSVLPHLFLLSKMAKLNFHVMWGQMPLSRRLSYLASLFTSREAAKEIRLFQLGEHFLGEHNCLFREQYRRFQELHSRRVFTVLSLGLLSALGYAAVITILVWDVAQGRLSLGMFVFVSGAFFACQSGAVTVTGAVMQLYESMLFLDNVYTFLASDLVRSDPAAVAPAKGTRRGAAVEFRNVGFRYPRQASAALRNISMRIDPGEIVAIVGENGAGKTTLIKLLTSLYRPSEGEVVIDGLAMGSFEESALRRKISVVFQDYVCYWASIGENIGFGDISRIDQPTEIEAAGKSSGVADFAKRLPQAYETLLSQFAEAGTQLSQGQWQRLALARALFHAGDVLVMDEPTASLDPSLEYEIFKELRNLAQGRTVILISHRFSNVRLADRIYVLDEGEIVESGSHEALMALKGEYARMFNLQAMAYR